MTTAVEEQQQTDPAFDEIPAPPAGYAEFVGFRTGDGETVIYTREILHRGRHVLLVAGSQVNFGGFKQGYDYYRRAELSDFFNCRTHGHTTTDGDTSSLIQQARVMDAIATADAVSRDAIHLHLVRLGAKYERAQLAYPRDYNTMDYVSAALAHLQGKFEDNDCGYMFRRGRNAVRKACELEPVTGW